MKINKVWRNLLFFCFLFFLIGSSFAYAMFQGGFISWFVFYSFLPFALYAVFFFLYPLREWEVKREVNKQEFYSGERLTVKVTIKRKIPFPLFYLVVQEVLPPALGYHTAAPKQFLYPLFRRKFSWEYEIQPLRRGEHVFRSFKLRSADPFGFINKEGEKECEDTILVFPAYETLHINRRKNSLGDSVAARKLNNNVETMMVAGVREYQQGDKISLVDWKATARKQTMMTKEFEAEQTQHTTVIMDCTKGQSFSGFENVVTYTASVIHSLLKLGRKCELISISESRNCLSLAKGTTSMKNVLYFLAKVDDSAQLPFSTVVLEECQRASSANHLVMITSSVSPELSAAVEKLARTSVQLVLISSNLSESEKAAIDKLQQYGIHVKTYKNLKQDTLHVR
jgi:uncharacterized protein (DUF58 family)